MGKPDRHPEGASAVIDGAAAVLCPGQMILASLSGPREKFWGALLELSALGLTLRGIELRSLDDFVRQLKAGEAVVPAVVFFPMHRLERIELDAPNGDIPSVAQQFQSKIGRSAQSLFVERGAGGKTSSGGGAS